MKKFLFLLLIPSFSFAQCKYDVDNFDPFLKIEKIEKAVTVNKSDWSGTGDMQLNFCNYNKRIFFRVRYYSNDGIVVDNKDAICFLLDNDSIVNAYPNQIYSGDPDARSSREILRATYYFQNENDINQLKESKVKMIRIYYNDIYVEYKIKDKFSDALFKTVKCF